MVKYRWLELYAVRECDVFAVDDTAFTRYVVIDESSEEEARERLEALMTDAMYDRWSGKSRPVYHVKSLKVPLFAG